MKPLRERNQAAVGSISLVCILLLLLAAYQADEIPLLNNSTTYSAHFAEAAGLESGDEVQVAGVKVGEVDNVELDGTHILATFSVESMDTSRIGGDTTAAIEIKTLLGDKFLAIEPEGEAPQDPNDVIPVERTDTPFELQDAFDELTTTVDEIDTDQLADSFDSLSDVMEDTPEPLEDTLDGLSSLSQTLSSRDQEIADLLSNTSQVTETLSERNDVLEDVIDDGNLLLDELQQRRDAISALLQGTQRLSAELSGVVEDNQDLLRPALEELDSVTDMLQRNQDNLEQGLELLAPFTRLGTNVTGNGRWFEGYICGLLPPTINLGFAEMNSQGCDPDAGAPADMGGGQ